MSRKFSALIFFCVPALFSSSFAQSVAYTFEVDGKVKKHDFLVVFYADGLEYKSVAKNGVMTIPSKIQTTDSFAVRLTNKTYDLLFEAVHLRDLKSEWAIGVDKKPFDKENLNVNLSYSEVCRIEFISFRSPFGHGKRIVNLEKIRCQ